MFLLYHRYVENGSLANNIKPNKFGPFPESLVALYIAQVCGCKTIHWGFSRIWFFYILFYTKCIILWDRCWKVWFIYTNRVLSIGILRVQTYWQLKRQAFYFFLLYTRAVFWLLSLLCICTMISSLCYSSNLCADEFSYYIIFPFILDLINCIWMYCY